MAALNLVFGLKEPLLDIISVSLDTLTTLISNHKEHLDYYMVYCESLQTFKRLGEILRRSPVTSFHIIKTEPYVLSLRNCYSCILELCVIHGWMQKGVEFCDIADLYLPPQHRLKEMRYRLLTLVGQQSPLSKLSSTKASQVWLDIARISTVVGDKVKSYQRAIELSKGSSQEILYVLEYLEFKSLFSLEDSDQMHLKFLENALSNLTINDLNSSILKLRVLGILLQSEKESDAMALRLRSISEIFEDLISTTYAFASTTMLEAQPADDKKDAKAVKGKKDAKEATKPEVIGESPKGDAWSQIKWPVAIIHCYKNCQEDGVFCLKNICQRKELIQALFYIVDKAIDSHYELCIPTLRILEMVAETEFPSVLSTINLMEWNILTSSGKESQAIDKYQNFVKLQSLEDSIKSDADYLGPYLFIRMSRLLIKHGHLLESEGAINIAYQLSKTKYPIYKSDVEIMMSWINVAQENFLKASELASSALANSTNSDNFSNAALLLIFSDSLRGCDISQKSLDFLTSATDHLKKLSESSTDALAIFSWVNLRLLKRLVYSNSAQLSTEHLEKVYTSYLHYMSHSTWVNKQPLVMADFVDTVFKLYTSGLDCKRQIHNYLSRILQQIESTLAEKENFSFEELELLFTVVKIELDSYLYPKEPKQPQTLDAILDEYLLNITDPALEMPVKAISILSSLHEDGIPPLLRGKFFFFKGLQLKMYPKELYSEDSHGRGVFIVIVELKH